MQLVRCALLTITFGILLITASCGDEMVVPTSGAAGMVISVEGKVTASRGGIARELKVDDVIYVEDTIATEAGATITIGLTHNNALWTVEEKAEEPVQGSLAWTAARQSASLFAKKDDTQTAAAASHVENTAGESAATVEATARAKRDQLPETEAVEEERVTKERVTTSPVATASPAKPTRIAEPAPDPEPIRPNRPRPKPAKPAPVVTMPAAKAPTKNRPVDSPKPPNTYGPRRNSDVKRDEPLRRPREDAPSPPPPARPKYKISAGADEKGGSLGLASQGATKKLILAIARQCKDKVNATGTMKYNLVVVDGKFGRFTTSGLTIEAFATCMRTKIKKSNLTKIASASGSLKFK